MGTSNYVTFGEFNKPEPPPSQNMYNMSSMNMHNDNSDYSEGYNQMPNQNVGYNYQQPQQPQQPAKYPIRQHVPYPRNPVTPQTQPKFYDNPYYYKDPLPKQNMVESFTTDLSFPSLDTTTTPIAQAFTSSPMQEMTTQQKSFRSPNPFVGQTCVDINDHVVNCPICSQYYQNYSSMYIGIIILLGFIILIFLLKSIMEIKR